MTISLGHGSGGRLSHKLIEEHFLPHLGNPVLAQLTDSAVLGDLALTTDGYVVTPRFFPGGDIGRLAVCGTVNDLAMVGAEPIGLTAGFILEEGLELQELDRIVHSMADAAKEAGVEVVAGDTKVVTRGACDGMFITTSGLGRRLKGFSPNPARAVPSDAVIISGTIGDHGMAVMACREGLPIKVDLESDVAPLFVLVKALYEAEIDVHVLRDPTRGGLAQSLIEISHASGAGILVEEEALPIRPPVRVASELLGIDPIYVANEGKLIALIPETEVHAALDVLRAHQAGKDAVVIGQVGSRAPGLEIKTALGARRRVRMPLGELLPRIC